MSPCKVEREFAGFEQLDEKRPGDAQQAGGLLRGQILHHGNNGNRFSLLHSVQDTQQKRKDGLGQFDGRPSAPADQANSAFPPEQFTESMDSFFLRSREGNGIERRCRHSILLMSPQKNYTK
jgi:hypothetical protein